MTVGTKVAATSTRDRRLHGLPVPQQWYFVTEPGTGYRFESGQAEVTADLYSDTSRARVVAMNT